MLAQHLSLVPAMSMPDALSSDYLEHHLVLPLALENGQLRIAAAGEPASYVIDDMTTLFGVPVLVIPADEGAIRDAIRRLRAASDSFVELVKDLDASSSASAPSDSGTAADIRDLVNQAPVVRFVSLLIREATESRASDIHLDATRDGMAIRFRIDGVLSPVSVPPRSLQDAVFSKLKLMAGLDIAERRLPQDGRIRVRLEERELDLRVATVPNHFGESMTLRLLDRGGRPVGLEELGMPTDVLDVFRAAAQRPHGIILATGPTGSGKTTTLYAALGLRDRIAEKIITVEDPIEYELDGVTQVPVVEKAGLTFPRALKALVRLDPDVLMIGEMRDEASADIAVRTAMTGHLVFSTLHTNDALSAVIRLMDLKVPAYMIAATIEVVLAQRLVRRTCPDCRERYRPDPQVVSLIAGCPVGAKHLHRGAGCPACRGTGYRGRSGIFELLRFTDRMKEALSRDANQARLREIAASDGMRTLKQDGWAKVEAGLTTVEEVLRVVQV
jgi:general secretion pathway protein E